MISKPQLGRSDSGFTLIELLVVAGILAILLAITIAAINPNKHFKATRDAQRQSDVSTILDAIYEYEASNRGSLPTVLQSITTGQQYNIASSGTSFVNLCTDLAPDYVADLPEDPQTGTKSGATTCAAASTYDTGYKLTETTTGNRFTISAPAAETGSISVTK